MDRSELLPAVAGAPIAEWARQAWARHPAESHRGGMIGAGADAFWETDNPQEPLSSPHGDMDINSYCHAWSCTLAHLLVVPELRT